VRSPLDVDGTQATVQQAMDGCPHWWMREALERLVARQAVLQSAL
jgi:diphosphoinositol-polyphosphate diphosphatase